MEKTICNNCTNCGACILSCPKKAITRKKDNLFFHACINQKMCVDCNLCKEICPQNKINQANNSIIKVCRLKNEKEISKSSSGGVFAALANAILLKKGIVYGAAFDDNFSVKHVRVDSVNGLKKILKSKYVKSNIMNTYVEAEKDLLNGKEVLYSGTPCQIAGLKSFLNKEYTNLYTIDLVCHGAPSELVWKKYIKALEKENNSRIKHIDFRYNNKKNPNKNFLIEFENGKVLNESLYENIYGKAFLTNIIFDDCCYNCKYKNGLSVSDITLGDAWGYTNKQYPNKNSIVFINNNHGNELFKCIENKLIVFDDYNTNQLFLNNYPIIHPSIPHYNSGKININNNIIKELSFWQIEKNSLKKYANGVGILNFHYENFNYGANLVAYSLSTILKKIGYEPVVIDFDPFDELDAMTRLQTINFLKFRSKNLKMTPRFHNRDELQILNKYFDKFVVGSDQVWRKAITKENMLTYFLDFVKNNKTIVAYGASFGHNKFEGTPMENLKCISLLKRFSGVSVRENDAIGICKNEFLTDSELVLDPTLLLTANDYDLIIDDSYNEKVEVALYFVMDHDNIIINDDNLKRIFPNKKITNIKGKFFNIMHEKMFCYNSISKWIDGVKKCEYLVTDSYHGVIFGIIYNKKIICIGKKSAALSRFNSLFETLGGNLNSINYSSLAEVDDPSKIDINYSIINSRIKKMKKQSIEFLEKSLQANSKDNQYQLFNETIAQLDLDFINFQQNEKDLDFLQKQLLSINSQISEMQNEYNKTINKLNQITAEYNRILYSKSWRITKPLRSVYKIMKGKK